MLYRGRDHYGIQVDPVEELVVVGHALNIGIDRPHMFQTSLAHVAHGPDPTFGQALEIADKIRAPIAAAYNTE